MTEEQDAELCAKYPKIFAGRNDQANLMQFGFECGSGWFRLINTLCREIQAQIDYVSEADSLSEYAIELLQVKAEQVKEKFGGLRFYVSGGDDEIRGMIKLAEAMSYHICEECGNEATVSTKSWIQRLCKPCSEKR